MSHVKLFSTITDSSIWDQPDHVCKIWITMLAMADWHGCVYASLPGLANRSRKSIREVEEALAVFRAPDPYSRTQDHDGRRIVDIDGGWMLLNYEKHRNARNAEALKESKREWAARQRASKKVEERRRESTTSNNGRRNDSVSVVSDLDLRSDPEGVQGEEELDLAAAEFVEDMALADPPRTESRAFAPEDEPQVFPDSAYDAVDVPARQAVLYELPDDWVPTERIVVAAQLAGLTRPQLDERIADLRLGTIGGKRGVLASKLEAYMLKLVPKWRQWYETEAAEAAAKSSRSRGREPPPPEPIRPRRKERDHCERHGYDIEGIFDAVNAEGWVARHGAENARREAHRRMAIAARSARGAGGA
jgi:hypothetical protein